MFPYSDTADLSLYEVCKYFINQTFYESGNLVSIMNLKKWNSLPKHLQKLMIDAIIDLEPQIYEIFARDQAAAKQKLIDNGMVPINFSPEDAKWYRNLAYSSFKGGAKDLCSPEKYAEILRLTGK
jgi:TRAP-type C4-dicarboxylate transport system substrate-binding protein